MENTEFLRHLSLVSPALGILLTLLLLLHSGSRERVWLALAIGALSLSLIGRYLFSIKSALLPYIPLLVFPLAWLFGPAFYRYACRQLGGRDDSSLWMKVGGAAALITLLLHVLVLLQVPEARHPESIVEQHGSLRIYTALFMCTLLPVTIFLIARALLPTLKPEEKPGAAIRKKWILLLGLILLAYIVFHFALGLLLLFGLKHAPFHSADILLALIMLSLIFHFLFNHPEVLQPQTGQPPRYAKQSLPPEDARMHLETLLEIMETKKPHLDDSITLAALSQLTGIPNHHLSMIINQELNKNFFNFLAEYRIKEAKRMLADPEFADYTILRIAYEAGFRSKGAFNSAFKKIVGKSPAIFRAESTVDAGQRGNKE